MGRIVMTDDLEKDHILHQRILLFSWVKEEHLDISVGEGSQGFIGFAQKGSFTSHLTLGFTFKPLTLTS
jgi:hypothetical protein